MGILRTAKSLFIFLIKHTKFLLVDRNHRFLEAKEEDNWRTKNTISQHHYNYHYYIILCFRVLVAPIVVYHHPL